MEKPATHNADLANLPPALAPLTEQSRWLIWIWELRKGKGGKDRWTKPPYQALYPRTPAKSNDPSTWSSYEDALAAVEAGDADGIGFALDGGDIGAADLDKCRDPEGGALTTWAEKLHEEANGAYCEVTVSGAGLRLVGTAKGPATHKRFSFDQEGAGVELYRNTARYITISGLEIGRCAELPPLDGFLDSLLARYDGAGYGATRGKVGLDASRGGTLDFNDAGRQSSSLDYDDLIRNGTPEGQRSEAFQAVVWHLAGRGWSIEQIVDELSRHPRGIAVKYADRLHVEVARSFDKWRSRKRAACDGETAAGDPWPQIRVIPSELPRVVNEAEQALIGLDREIYQYGPALVRPVLTTVKTGDNREDLSCRLQEVTAPYLVETLCRAAQFKKFDARSRAFVPIDAPKKVAETYLARGNGEWKLPKLVGIANTPFLRADGSLCEQPGYDATSGVLFKPDGWSFPPIPSHPDKDEAIAALGEIATLISTFPFVTPADRAVALSAIFTALDRCAMMVAPMHGFTSPVAGSGKSLLADLVAMLTTGRSMPVIAPGANEEELEKRLTGSLLKGAAVISIDNCARPLESAFLCQVLTQARVEVRPFGTNTDNREIPGKAAIYCTGNNLVLVGDLSRRALMCSIDPECERPELRRFDIDILKFARAKRGRLVTAALTVLRAWHVAKGGEAILPPPLGSFEDWSRRVREPLVWLGYADPCDTLEKVRESDPERERLGAVLAQWENVLGVGKSYSIQQVIDRAHTHIDLQTALLAVASGSAGSMFSNDRLGRWLKKVEGKIVGGRVLRKDRISNGCAFWRLDKQ